MCVIAHPDDESFGLGPAIAKYAAEGVSVSVICATRGERGWMGAEQDNPGLEKLGQIREAELRTAVKVLGVSELTLLEYIDGEVDQAEPAQFISTLAHHLRRFRPQIVLTFDPFGAYGHPDHVAICQLTTAAIVQAAHQSAGDVPPVESLVPHTVSKLYYLADTAEFIDSFEAIVGEIAIVVNGTKRQNVVWPKWSISAVIDAREYWPIVWQAFQAHTSQQHEFAPLADASQELRESICGIRTFYRAYSFVTKNNGVEADLFEGLRV